jgi:hypothetical protein
MLGVLGLSRLAAGDGCLGGYSRWCEVIDRQRRRRLFVVVAGDEKGGDGEAFGMWWFVVPRTRRW